MMNQTEKQLFILQKESIKKLNDDDKKEIEKGHIDLIKDKSSNLNQKTKPYKLIMNAFVHI